MSIPTIEAAISSIVAGVTSIQAAYTYPVAELGRKLPALLILYDGFDQEPAAVTDTETAWRFEFTLYLPADGKTLQKAWTDLKTLVPAILSAFRVNPGLNASCYDSIIQAGEPIMHIPQEPNGQPKFVGHTFKLTARKVEG